MSPPSNPKKWMSNQKESAIEPEEIHRRTQREHHQTLKSKSMVFIPSKSFIPDVLIVEMN